MFDQFLSYIYRIFFLDFNRVNIAIRQRIAYVAHIYSTSFYIYALTKKRCCNAARQYHKQMWLWERWLHPQPICTAGTNVFTWQTSLSHSYDHLHFPPNIAGRGHSLHMWKQQYHWTLRMLLLLPREVSPCMSMHTPRVLSHSFSQLWRELQWDSTVTGTLFVSLCEANFVSGTVWFLLYSFKQRWPAVHPRKFLCRKILAESDACREPSPDSAAGKGQKDSSSSQAKPKCSLSGRRKRKRRWGKSLPVYLVLCTLFLDVWPCL